MNNFIFTPQNDPLLNPEVIDRQLEQLKLLKQKVTPNTMTNLPKPPQDLWAEIENELSTLTEEQKQDLMRDEQFIERQNAIQVLYQNVLTTLVKPYLLSDEDGIKALQEQLETVKTLKRKIVKESTRKNELVNEYMENYSDKTWNEFLEIKKSQSTSNQR